MMAENQINLADAYIERCDKETEEMIAEEKFEFLSQSIQFLKNRKNEFIYLESNSFEKLGVDSLCMEVDDVFGTYDVMLGLKLQKKFEKAIKTFLEETLQGEDTKFDLIFDQKDGLWNLNYTLNYSPGFSEEMTLGESFKLISDFLSHLIESVKEDR